MSRPGAPRRSAQARADRSARPISFRMRLGVVFFVMLGIGAALVGRAVQLQLVQHRFLASEGAARFTRVAAIVAHRGTITDRYGEPLAVSTPVDSVWVNPRSLSANTEQLPRLAKAINVDLHELVGRVSTGQDREFMYVARGLQPADARKVRQLQINGVNLAREYRRYYPAGEVTGHLLGFTDVDDTGQEGAELAYDNWLGGEDGAKRVIQDSQGNRVEDVESIRAVRPGRELKLSIDLRIQYLAYRELKAAVRDNRARSGSVVVMDVRTGEVLAMVNQPAFNPNDRHQLNPTAYRNRAATDLFEPGSSIKPFFVAAGLASGRYQADSIIDTSPGYIQVGTSMIHDEHNLGSIPLATVLAFSSNVGMAHLALSLEPKQIWGTLDALRLRAGHRQRLSGRVGRPVIQLLALAQRPDRQHVARLRPFGDAAPAGAGLRHARRAGSSAPGLDAARGRARSGRSGARTPGVRAAPAPARIGDHDARGHRQAGGDPGLSHRRQNRHRLEGRGRGLFAEPLRRGVRGRRTGEQSEARGRGGDR